MSHEMRNPLNAIIAQCTVFAMIIADFAAFIFKIRHKLTPDELDIANKIQEKIVSSVNVMKTSSRLLLFNVEDVLGMAQIRAQKFQKTISEFNLRRCLEEVVSIQQFKAEQQNITLKAEISVLDMDLSE